MSILLVGVLVLVAVLILSFLGVLSFFAITYNHLVRLRNSVKNAMAQIDAQLQRRFDLIPNLEETVKGLEDHELTLLSSIADSRSNYLSAGSEAEKLAMNTQLTSTLNSLYAVTKAHPELKTNSNYLKLQEELSEAEDKVTFARQFYNDAVTIYNNKLQMFPSNLIARMFGFTEAELFDVDDVARDAQRVDF
ncbi:MAG: LemA family protein [Lachnospiraceae bacterium]|nr:LemA family protein [Lachnospiraceae bacterium]